MDGHVVIEGSAGLKKLPADIFQALGIKKMVHLEAEPACIKANRSNDTSRHRPAHDLETLSRHQLASFAHAKSIAAALDIEFQSVTHGDVADLARDLLRA